MDNFIAFQTESRLPSPSNTSSCCNLNTYSSSVTSGTSKSSLESLQNSQPKDPSSSSFGHLRRIFDSSNRIRTKSSMMDDAPCVPSAAVDNSWLPQRRDSMSSNSSSQDSTVECLRPLLTLVLVVMVSLSLETFITQVITFNYCFQM